MALRFLADHCISNLIIESLRDAGHEVIRLKEVARADSPDSVVLSVAQKAEAILVSLNGDFADIVAYPPGRYLGIIALQERDHPETIPLILTRLIEYLNLQPEMNHYRGKLFVVDVVRIRIRT